jgi:hypothetical protein
MRISWLNVMIAERDYPERDNHGYFLTGCLHIRPQISGT